MFTIYKYKCSVVLTIDRYKGSVMFRRSVLSLLNISIGQVFCLL